MDDELIWSARMKMMIAQDNPQILGFDESKFAAKLHSEEQDAELAVRILRREKTRRLFSVVLRASRMPLSPTPAGTMILASSPSGKACNGPTSISTTTYFTSP